MVFLGFSSENDSVESDRLLNILATDLMYVKLDCVISLAFAILAKIFDFSSYEFIRSTT